MSAEHAPVTHIKTPPTLADLVARRAELRADAEHIASELEQVDAALILRLDIGTHDVGDSKVEIREYSRTDLKWIEEQYPPSQYPQLYKVTTAVDGDAVKKQFAPAVLAEHKITGKKSVVVK